VYICTAADREYAQEAWRVLDPDGTVISHAELASKRMLCVPHPEKKDLLNVLRWQEINAQMRANPQGPTLMITDQSE
jgi:hypothetical protein